MSLEESIIQRRRQVQGNDYGPGGGRAGLEGHLWVSSENEYYGTTVKSHLDTEFMVDHSSWNLIMHILFKIFLENAGKANSAPT